MREFFVFIKGNFNKVSFGWLLTFISGFGQTYLLSLYVPEVIRSFQISEGTFGAIYAGCTVTASLVMLTIGHTVDHIPVKKITAYAIMGLALSSISMGLSYHVVFLIIALIGLRLTGQGLLIHISMTVISKQFISNRGKALSFSSLGFSMGEALFPLIISSLISFFDWRLAVISTGIVVLFYLLRLKNIDLSSFDQQLSSSGRPSGWTLLRDYKEVVRDRKFLVLIPAIFALSFSVTAVFFYQYVFVENKGWSVQLYATFFTVYAITRFLFSLLGGMWVDQFSAKKMFRFFMIPISLGLVCMAFVDNIVGALVFLIATGVTVGMSGTVKTALFAELYGTEKMGAIRSVFTMFSVISTALGPLAVGLLMDMDVRFEKIIFGLFVLIGITVLNAQRIRHF